MDFISNETRQLLSVTATQCHPNPLDYRGTRDAHSFLTMTIYYGFNYIYTKPNDFLFIQGLIPRQLIQLVDKLGCGLYP